MDLFKAVIALLYFLALNFTSPRISKYKKLDEPFAFAALKSSKVEQHISGQRVLEVIYVPGKILNIRTEPVE